MKNVIVNLQLSQARSIAAVAHVAGRACTLRSITGANQLQAVLEIV